jgi:hypothetical protein
MILKIIIGLSCYFIGWYIGYNKGYKKNKLYRNMFDNKYVDYEEEKKTVQLYKNTRSGALSNDRINERQ